MRIFSIVIQIEADLLFLLMENQNKNNHTVRRNKWRTESWFFARWLAYLYGKFSWIIISCYVNFLFVVASQLHNHCSFKSSHISIKLGIKNVTHLLIKRIWHFIFQISHFFFFLTLSSSFNEMCRHTFRKHT